MVLCKCYVNVNEDGSFPNVSANTNLQKLIAFYLTKTF